MCPTILSHLRILALKSLIFYQMVDLSREDLNLLFQVLEDWETHLAQYDLDDLRCGDEHNKQ